MASIPGLNQVSLQNGLYRRTSAKSNEKPPQPSTKEKEPPSLKVLAYNVFFGYD